MKITAQDVKKLREATGVSMMQCKKSLVEAKGDFDKAKEILKKKGMDKAEKRLDKETNEGTIGTYIHTNGKLGAMVVLRCETDFVAKNEDFKQLANDLAMHVVAMNPEYVSSEEISEEKIDEIKKDILNEIKREAHFKNLKKDKKIASKAQIDDDNVKSFFDDIPDNIIDNIPDNIKEKMIDGKIKKKLDSVSLLKQKSIKDDVENETIIKETIVKVGENITVQEFCRFEL